MLQPDACRCDNKLVSYSQTYAGLITLVCVCSTYADVTLVYAYRTYAGVCLPDVRRCYAGVRLPVVRRCNAGVCLPDARRCKTPAYLTERRFDMTTRRCGRSVVSVRQSFSREVTKQDDVSTHAHKRHQQTLFRPIILHRAGKASSSRLLLKLND